MQPTYAPATSLRWGRCNLRWPRRREMTYLGPTRQYGGSGVRRRRANSMPCGAWRTSNCNFAMARSGTTYVERAELDCGPSVRPA